MKGLKKLALATAVAAAPFAQAELTAMDDALLEEMTGQAGITIDVDLDMSIDAIKYVDRDGNREIVAAAGGAGTGDHDINGDPQVGGDYEITGTQGAITIKGLKMGSDNGTDDWDTARIRGITIDVDGNDGLVMGLNQIGDELGNGIDIAVEAVIIGNGYANLAKTELGVAAAGATPTEQGDAPAAAVSDGAFADAAAFSAALAGGDMIAMQYLAGQNAGVNTAFQKALSGGDGHVGGFKITNFRNYIQDSLVNEYNGVFDMALQDSNGTVGGVTGIPGTSGRFVKGEIVIEGTGNYAQGTAGLKISGEFGGAIDEAAWIDEGSEFGVADLGFFHGVDENGDDIADVIEGMHFAMNIDVVEHQSWNGGGATDVTALQISGLEMKGTIMMGSLYLDGDNTVYDTDGTTVITANTIERQSLGSVLIKDIDMTGTSVKIYGH